MVKFKYIYYFPISTFLFNSAWATLAWKLPPSDNEKLYEKVLQKEEIIQLTERQWATNN